MVIVRFAKRGYTDADFRADPLVQKLREVVLNGREKNASDRTRAAIYNVRCKMRGLAYRAR